FRTMKVTAGLIEFWPQHYAKLVIDCARLGIAAPSEATLLGDIAQLARLDHATSDHSIKIIVTRGESARGYMTPADITPNRIVQRAALPVYSPHLYTEGAVLRVCETRASWQPALAGIKHLNRLENVLARREWTDPNIFDGLMLDRDGLVIEGVMSNVFALIDGFWCTPKLNQSGVAGVYREMLLQLNDCGDIPFKECDLTLAELYSAKAIFVCNSLAACVPVRQIEQQHWRVDLDLMKQVQQRLSSKRLSPIE
ncbi:MAG: aminodeoxychorismate lyase, partial [Deefgea sp.]